MPPEKLRIAFATPEYVTETDFDGGLANYIHRVSKSLAHAGHDVHVVTLSRQNEERFNHDGVVVHRVVLKRAWQWLNRATRYRLPTTLHWLNFSRQVYLKLKQLHREQAFHLIQYPNYSSCGVFSIPLLRTTHVVRASSYQRAWSDAAGLQRNFDLELSERLESLQYRFTRNVFAPSYALRKMLREKTTVCAAAVIRTPFYVETENWDNTIFDQFLKDKAYVLYFGRFQLHKGVQIFARALSSFLNQHRDAYAVLVGRDMETSLAPSMAAFARSLCGGTARLIIIDNLRHEQLYPIVAGARLVALPSLIDNSPNTCLEAMGLGKVVIGTKGTSFDELITDGVNGFLVPPNDANALAEKMIAAWRDPQLEALSEAAKERMTEFAPDKTIASLLDYYKRAIRE